MITDDTVKNKVKELLLSGKKPKAIAAEMGGGITPEEIYPVAQEMRKTGELKKTTAASAPLKSPATQSKPKGKKEPDQFQIALKKEISDVQSEIDRLQRLVHTYSNTKSDFCDVLDQKIKAETKKLTALQEFQKN